MSNEIYYMVVDKIKSLTRAELCMFKVFFGMDRIQHNYLSFIKNNELYIYEHESIEMLVLLNELFPMEEGL